MLYGLTVDSNGHVFIAQTDARNDANGRAGTKKHGIKEMENRAFLNQITKVGFKDGSFQEPKFINLEPLPPKHPEKGMALATPYAVQVSGDDSIVRDMLGATSGLKANAGTIRGDFSSSRQMNLVHASDSTESAAREISLYFGDKEVCGYTPTLTPWFKADDE